MQVPLKNGTVANIRGNIIMLSKDHRRSEHKEW